MSGKKQHYIPQVLLRGFSLADTKFPPIAVYSRERGFYKTNTRDTAAENEFYSPVLPEGGTLDDEITTYEDELKGQLAKIKEAPDGLVDSELAALVIVHLTLRNDHTRRFFGGAGEGVLSAVRDLFRKTENARAMMGFDRPFKDSMAKQEIRAEIKKRYPFLTPIHALEMEEKMIREAQQRFDEFYEKQKIEIEALTERMLESVPEMAEGAHKKALRGNLTPPELRVQVLKKLNWKLVSGDFLLPDCVAVSFVGDDAFPYMLTHEDDMKFVFMPLSRELGLFGTVEEFPLPSSSRLKEMSAACSADFFVSHSVEDALKPLIATIGQRTAQRIDHLVKEAVISSKQGRLIDSSNEGSP